MLIVEPNETYNRYETSTSKTSQKLLKSSIYQMTLKQNHFLSFWIGNIWIRNTLLNFTYLNWSNHLSVHVHTKPVYCTETSLKYMRECIGMELQCVSDYKSHMSRLTHMHTLENNLGYAHRHAHRPGHNSSPCLPPQASCWVFPKQHHLPSWQ